MPLEARGLTAPTHEETTELGRLGPSQYLDDQLPPLWRSQL
jgi:hypothetical protein